MKLQPDEKQWGPRRCIHPSHHVFVISRPFIIDTVKEPIIEVGKMASIRSRAKDVMAATIHSDGSS
jgi:hypothetical protein